MLTAEVVEAVRVAQGRRSSLEPAERRLPRPKKCTASCRPRRSGMIGGKGRFDALEPLLAVQALSQARMQYLGSIVGTTVAEFRLLAVGQPIEATRPLGGQIRSRNLM